MAKPLSQHMTSLIRNLTDAQLAERIAAFERTKKSWGSAGRPQGRAEPAARGQGGLKRKRPGGCGKHPSGRSLNPSTPS